MVTRPARPDRMATTINFIGTTDAAAHLGVSVSWLRARKSEHEFTPGEHWIYATGRPGGRLLWNITAIQKWQAEQTLLSVEQQQSCAASIETYVEVGDE